MSDGYKPRKGSLAEKVLAHLAKKPAPLTTNEIAKLFGGKRMGVRSCLAGAIKAGAIAVTQEGPTLFFSMAEEPPPTDGKLTISSWSDGDTLVAGGQPNEDGSITYTREQLLQLIRFVTQPALGMPIVSELVPAATPLLPVSQE